MSIRQFEEHAPVIDPSAWVDPTALVIGQVEMGADSSVWPMAVARGDIHRIRIGCRTNIQDGTVIHVNHDSPYHPGGMPALIGDEVTVGHKAMLHACTLEDRCLVGMGAVVLDGAVVGSRALVGAGSVVPPGRELEGGYLWLGSPVRRVRELTPDELDYFTYSAEYYAGLKERHRGHAGTG